MEESQNVTLMDEERIRHLWSQVMMTAFSPIFVLLVWPMIRDMGRAPVFGCIWSTAAGSGPHPPKLLVSLLAQSALLLLAGLFVPPWLSDCGQYRLRICLFLAFAICSKFRASLYCLCRRCYIVLLVFVMFLGRSSIQWYIPLGPYLLFSWFGLLWGHMDC